jgi:hypothetical protein
MTCIWIFLGTAQPARDPDTLQAESSHEVSLLTNCATNDNSWPREKIAEECSSCCVGAVSLAEWLLGTVPHIHGLWPVSAGSSLFVRNQTAPDEGYIRHALSYFPTITPWSWTTTISVPCLPLGYVDPAYVSQYCQWPRGAPISNFCPPHPICTVRVTSLSVRYYSATKPSSSFDLPASSSDQRYVPTKCPCSMCVCVLLLAIHDSLCFWYRFLHLKGALCSLCSCFRRRFFFSGVARLGCRRSRREIGTATHRLSIDLNREPLVWANPQGVD